jgi:phosphohistidine phosphatase SixA
MIARTRFPATIAATALLTALTIDVGVGQQISAAALVPLLRNGGHVMVMRHASSPRETPNKQTANADNLQLERQLDQAGRSSSTAMGNALRALGIPVGDVLVSPTYRARETARLAQLPNPRPQVELGDGGKSMQGVSDEQGVRLRQRASTLPKGTNTLIVTHQPNIARAFPDWGEVADGEIVVVGSDGKGGIRPLGRIRIEQWPALR